eukprot:1195244-Prorocentrum_minimum.AAC.8
MAYTNEALTKGQPTRAVRPGALRRRSGWGARVGEMEARGRGPQGWVTQPRPRPQAECDATVTELAGRAGGA